jgi:carboxymethylenebutenolidase
MRSTIFLLLIVALLSACSNVEKPQQDEGMNKFASSNEFQNTHEEPGDLDYQGLGEYIKVPTPSGEDANAFFIASETPSQDYLLIIHEWWGLNEYAKKEAEKLYKQFEHINVLAIDMYDGKVATNREDASTFMQAVKDRRAAEIVASCIAYTGEEANIATLGWCFGGGWSLKTAIEAREKASACVIYYGSPVKSASELAPLQAPVLGIFAEKDKWINHEMIDDFKELSFLTKKTFDEHWFEADHAFANPSGGRYNEAAAQDAYKLVVSFLEKNWHSKN